MNGIAHISSAGGGVFVPARTPYDRQMLVEHIAARVRSKGEVRVTVDARSWWVRLNRGVLSGCCTHCGQPLRAACYAAGLDGPAYCVSCAFLRETPPDSHREMHRTA